MDKKLDIKEIKAVEDAVKYMTKLAKYQRRILIKAEGAAKGQKKDISDENLEKEKKDLEEFEKDIYEYLLMMIRSMNALIKIEKEEDIIEKNTHIHNKEKDAIAEEVRFLIRKLRKIYALDEKGF